MIVRGDARLQDDTLEGLAAAVEYRRWICDLARPWLGTRPIEIGSGTGDHALEMAATAEELTASEATPERVAGLRRRFAETPGLTVRTVILPTNDEQVYTSAVAINVLEHIDDDVASLCSMRSLVEPGGHVVVFVPAFESAMSDFDRSVGHVRRYRRDVLAARLVEAGLEPVTVHYVNAPGLLAWYVLVRALRGRPRDGIALRAFERAVPRLRALEARWQPPFGQSVFAVGRRPRN